GLAYVTGDWRHASSPQPVLDGVLHVLVEVLAAHPLQVATISAGQFLIGLAAMLSEGDGAQEDRAFGDRRQIERRTVLEAFYKDVCPHVSVGQGPVWRLRKGLVQHQTKLIPAGLIAVALEVRPERHCRLMG